MIPKQDEFKEVSGIQFIQLTKEFLTAYFGKNINQTRKLYFDELSITTEGAQKLHDYLLTPRYNIAQQPKKIQKQVFWILHTNEAVGDRLACSLAWYIEQKVEQIIQPILV